MQVERLPVKMRERQHAWPPGDAAKRLHGSEFEDGCDRTERGPCGHCGLIKITVHSLDGKTAWREWRTKAGQVWIGSATPPCLDGVG